MKTNSNKIKIKTELDDLGQSTCLQHKKEKVTKTKRRNITNSVSI